jgi:hypothetical protein
LAYKTKKHLQSALWAQIRPFLNRFQENQKLYANVCIKTADRGNRDDFRVRAISADFVAAMGVRPGHWTMQAGSSRIQSQCLQQYFNLKVENWKWNFAGVGRSSCSEREAIKKIPN